MQSTMNGSINIVSQHIYFYLSLNCILVGCGILDDDY